MAKRSATVIAAWITGVCAVVAAVVGGLIAITGDSADTSSKKPSLKEQKTVSTSGEASPAISIEGVMFLHT